jgi:hypothetical protein
MDGQQDARAKMEPATLSYDRVPQHKEHQRHSDPRRRGTLLVPETRFQRVQ